MTSSAQQDRWREFHADCFGGPEVDDEFESGSRFDWYFGRLRL